MKSDLIYINPQGVPCAPTEYAEFIDILLEQASRPHGKSDGGYAQLKAIKASCFPIREEDQGLFPKLKGIKTDCFYEVEPYEFEVEDYSPVGWLGKPKQQVRIIRPSEPKYDAGNLNSSDARNYGKIHSEPKAN